MVSIFSKGGFFFLKPWFPFPQTLVGFLEDHTPMPRPAEPAYQLHRRQKPCRPPGVWGGAAVGYEP